MWSIDFHRVLRCLGCETITFQHEWVFSENLDHDGVYPVTSLYPPRLGNVRTLDDADLMHLPYHVGRILAETVRALETDAPLLATAGLRALVEAICNDRGVQGKDLWEKINGLVEAGVMTSQNADVLLLHKDFGNAAIHELEAPTADVLHMLFEILMQLVRTTYVVPALAKRIVATSPPPRRTRATGQSGPQA